MILFIILPSLSPSCLLSHSYQHIHFMVVGILLILCGDCGLLQVVHTLSVSLNKIGDLKYYDADLQAARASYSQSLDLRRSAVKQHPSVPSQVSKVSCHYFSLYFIILKWMIFLLFKIVNFLFS